MKKLIIKILIQLLPNNQKGYITDFSSKFPENPHWNHFFWTEEKAKEDVSPSTLEGKVRQVIIIN